MKTDNSYRNHDNGFHESQAYWFAVRVIPRREKNCQAQLTGLGVEAFVPLIETTRRYASKIKTLHLPLISQYVFVKISKSQFVTVISHPDVVGFIKTGNKYQRIKEEDIQWLGQVTGVKQQDVSIRTTQLQIGQAIEIASGHLAGMRGVLTKIEGKHRFVVQLQSVGMDLVMAVDPAWIRPKAFTS